MSVLSRLPPDVQRAVSGWRWAREEAQRQHIRDAQPVTRAQMIGDIRRNIESAEMIRRDIRDCHARRDSDPIRWAIGIMKDADRRSLLAATLATIKELIDDIEADAGRAVPA